MDADGTHVTEPLLGYPNDILYYHIDRLEPEIRNSSVLSMELRLSFINPSKYWSENWGNGKWLHQRVSAWSELLVCVLLQLSGGLN